MDSSSSSSSSSSDRLQRLSLLAMGIPKRELMQEMSAHKQAPAPPEPVPAARKPSNHERNIDGVATASDAQATHGIFRAATSRSAERTFCADILQQHNGGVDACHSTCRVPAPQISYELSSSSLMQRCRRSFACIGLSSPRLCTDCTPSGGSFPSAPTERVRATLALAGHRDLRRVCYSPVGQDSREQHIAPTYQSP